MVEVDAKVKQQLLVGAVEALPCRFLGTVFAGYCRWNCRCHREDIANAYGEFGEGPGQLMRDYEALTPAISQTQTHE